MKCNHCLVEFHPDELRRSITSDTKGEWVILSYECPACHNCNFFLQNNSKVFSGGGYTTTEKSIVLIYPRATSRPPCPVEVPSDLMVDYVEACLVLYDSPKASAALSRRCLQNLLRDYAKVKPKNLYYEIEEIISRNQLPSQLSDLLHAVRTIGNFAAHPTKSTNTGQILPVEPSEAELNLEVLEGLFDYYFVLPMKSQIRIAQINKKLSEAGKPTI